MLKFKKGDIVKTHRGTGKIVDVRNVGGIPWVGIKYKGGYTVGTNAVENIKRIRK